MTVTRSKPRVAIVAASLDILGGQGVQARTLVDALRGEGYDVMFLPINPAFPAGLGWVRRFPGVRTIVNQSFYVPSLARLASADVVHVFSASYWSFLLAPVPAMLAARSMNKRVILHYHSGEADDHLSHWGPLVKPWLRLADEIVVPSEYLRRVFARHGYAVRVIPNVIDLSEYRFRDRLPLRPRMLSTRNLEPYYRVDLVIEAFNRFKAIEPAATLTIAGYGSEEARLRRLAAQGARDSIRFVGKVDRQLMPQLYNEADIFVNASVVDNQPVSILEAFAAGLPVVSTATGDIPFMVEHGRTGLVVSSPRADMLADAMCALWRDPRWARDMARRARDEATKYTWPACRTLWAQAYAAPDRSVDEIVIAAQAR
jgi:glycosyltransferase involved in cell wall biosynthesis